MTQLYLASGSPRRRELLTQIGVPFTVVSAPIDETPLPGEAPAAYVERLAQAKAVAGFAHTDGRGVVLGADTTVVLDGQILGKPENREQALAMLGDLSKREHQVLTAVALTDGRRSVSCCVSTRVRFRTISFEQALRYWDSGEPVDKAGGYAIRAWARFSSARSRVAIPPWSACR